AAAEADAHDAGEVRADERDVAGVVDGDVRTQLGELRGAGDRRDRAVAAREDPEGAAGCGRGERHETAVIDGGDGADRAQEGVARGVSGPGGDAEARARGSY